jgi:putative copper export protein
VQEIPDMSWYLLNVSVHVLAAVVWLGGMFFFALVGAPVLRSVADPRIRAALFRSLGRQFRTVGWMAIGVLLVTGVLNLYLKGLLGSDGVASAHFWSTRYGHTLAWKLAAVATMLVIQSVHDFIFGPASSRATPGSPEALRLRRVAAWLARLSAVVGVLLLFIAVRLARGG